MFAAATEGWAAALDCINLATALHRLGHLADATPGGVAGLRPQLLAPAGVCGWLLDCLAAAAQAPEWSARCTANVLAAVCKLDALSPSLLRALHAPLLRTLAGATPDRLTGSGLTQVLWALSRDAGMQPLLLAAKQPLLGALRAATPTLDAQVGAAWAEGKAAAAGAVLLGAPLFSQRCDGLLIRPIPSLTQGVGVAWKALGDISSRCTPRELHLEREAPDLLPRLAAAAKAAAHGMTLQSLAEVTWGARVLQQAAAGLFTRPGAVPAGLPPRPQVLHACTKVRPQPYRDEALLQSVAVAISRRCGCRARRCVQAVLADLLPLTCFSRVPLTPPYAARSCHCRLHGGGEQAAAAALARMVQALGRLAYVPRCYWCCTRGVLVSPLDDVCTALAKVLPQASPQDICCFLGGLGQLDYAPPAPALRAVMDHLAPAGPAQPPAAVAQPTHAPAQRAESTTRSRGSSVAEEGDGGGGSGVAQGAEVPVAAGSCDELERYSCEELVDLVGACAGWLVGRLLPFWRCILRRMGSLPFSAPLPARCPLPSRPHSCSGGCAAPHPAAGALPRQPAPTRLTVPVLRLAGHAAGRAGASGPQDSRVAEAAGGAGAGQGAGTCPLPRGRLGVGAGRLA